MKKRVLVVEDNLPISANLGEIFQAFGYRSAFTSSGQDALDKVRDLRPDLIIMDILLPGRLSGIDVAMLLRKEYDNTPIIFASADVSTSTKEVVSLFGIILKKPFGMHELLAVVKEVLND